MLLFSRTTFARELARPSLLRFAGLVLFTAAMLFLIAASLTPARAAGDPGLDDTITTQLSTQRTLYADAAPVAPQEVPPIADSQLARPAVVPVATPAPAIAPVQNANGSWDFSPLLDGLIKFVGAVAALVGTFLLSKLGGVIGLHIDAKEIAKDLSFEDQATKVVQKIFAIVEQRTGWTAESLKNVDLKNVYLQWAAALLLKQYPEIWRYLENQKGNALEWIEGQLGGASKPEPMTVDQAKAALAGAAAPKAATG